MKQWDYETNFSHYDRNLKLDEKLTAAVEGQCEFMDRNRFVQNLQMAGIGRVSTEFLRTKLARDPLTDLCLNAQKVISTSNLINLAVHEPQTFSCLIEIAHRFEHEKIWEGAGVDNKPENCFTNLPDYS